MDFNIESMLVDIDASIIEAMAIINKNGHGIVYVCENDILYGTVTDGDIRRHILKGKNLSAIVKDIANSNFQYVLLKDIKKVPEILSTKNISSIPVLNEYGKLISVHFSNRKAVIKSTKIDAPVVIMAGGKGTRLYPYTKILPKPLIPIGDDTITEQIVKQFTNHGCNDFTMIVNHKKEMIRAYFKEKNTSYEMKFIEELEPLGTGGGLYLLKDKIKETFFLTNCDILIFEEMDKILDFHKNGKYLITMVCAMKSVTVPYGTVVVDNQSVTVLNEKPTSSYLINTGVYVIEPEFLTYIPENTFIHITDIINICIEKELKIGAYPISEGQWSDMGQPEELDKMIAQLGV